MKHIKNVALLVAFSLVLAGCVVAAPPPGPEAHWVPGHYTPYGYWVPGHWVAR